MTHLLLAVIYLAFISLGLPDALLGAAWPVMYTEMAAPLSYAGILSMIISLGTIVSSLLSDRLTRRLGSGLVTAVSVGVTAAALFYLGVTAGRALNGFLTFRFDDKTLIRAGCAVILLGALLILALMALMHERLLKKTPGYPPQGA